MTEPGLRARLHWQRDGRRFSFQADLPGRGVTALFGPSGAGKSSCLRAIAGLDRDCQGRLAFAGQPWQDDQLGLFVPTHRRRLGYVMQEAGLFPHLSVAGNLDFGKRRASDRVALQRDALVEAFGLAGLLQRRPGGLSGGERQRVAIVRALLSEPVLLLLDEPLSALDSHARSTLLATLEHLHAQWAVPMLYVSHSIEEVARLADHLLLIEDGRIIAAGPLQDTLSRTDLPPTLADALGTVIEGHVAAHEDDQLSRFAFRGGHLLLPRRAVAVGTPIRCRIAARDVSLALRPALDSSVLNQLPATVLAIAGTADPSQCLVQLQAGSQRLLARISQRSRQALALAPGQAVHAQIKATAL